LRTQLASFGYDTTRADFSQMNQTLERMKRELGAEG